MLQWHYFNFAFRMTISSHGISSLQSVLFEKQPNDTAVLRTMKEPDEKIILLQSLQ